MQEDDVHLFTYQPRNPMLASALNAFSRDEQTVLRRLDTVFSEWNTNGQAEQGRMNALHGVIEHLPKPYNSSERTLRALLERWWKTGGVLDTLGVPEKQRTDVEFTLDTVIHTHFANLWEAHLQVAGQILYV